MPQLANAADSSVPVDGSGYLDDRNTQMPAAASTPASSKKKSNKSIEQDEEPEEAALLLTQVTAQAPEESPFPLIPVIGGLLVLAALIGGGVFFARRPKNPAPVVPSAPAPAPAPSAASVRSPTASSLSRPPSSQSNVKLPPASGSQPEGTSVNGLSNNEISRLTSIDERGRNPSGIIIDEDKYFSGGKESFVDEDKS